MKVKKGKPMTTAYEFLKIENDFLQKRIEYLESIVQKQNKIRREISSYLIEHRYNLNVFDALDIIYPKVDENMQPAEPEKGTEE